MTDFEIELNILMTRVNNIETPDSVKKSEAIRSLMKAQRLISEL